MVPSQNQLVEQAANSTLAACMNAPNSDVQDVQDMSRLAAGHDTALNELMARHTERLLHYLVRSLQCEEKAADLAQETFVKVYQKRTRFDPRQKFSLASLREF